MKNFNIKKLNYIILVLLLIIYIVLLLGIIKIQYNALTSIEDINIYNAISQYNWKYWFEESNNFQTIFALFLQYIDINYLYKNGILPIIINIIFMFFLTILIITIINDTFKLKDNHTIFIKKVLIFSTIIITLSTIQDSSIIWIFNQQIFASYFFPLFSYYLLMKFSLTNNNKYFYTLLLSSLMIIISTPYYFSALFVLILLGFIFKIGWLKNLILFTLILVSIFIYYDNIPNIEDILSLTNSNITSQELLFFLNYLGSLFSYISFEPCIATSSIVAGLIVLGTFFYFTYLVITKKSTNEVYWVILAFLFFYFLTAFSNLSETNTNNIIIFKNQYITPSLIAWSLILILYIHHFNKEKIIQRRLLTISMTLVIGLFFYQVYTYTQYKKNIDELKVGVATLKLGIYDQRCLNSITRSVYLMKYIPSNESDKQMSIFTVNDIKEKIIKEKIIKEKNSFNFSKKINKSIIKSSSIILKGGLDKIKVIDKKKNIIKIIGWVYNEKDKKVPNWLIVLNENKNFIGYIITGESREDVGSIYGKDSEESGFIGYIKYLETPSTIFMVDDLGEQVFKVKYPKLKN